MGELIRGRDAANGTLEACAPEIYEFRCEKFRETFMSCFDFIHDDPPFFAAVVALIHRCALSADTLSIPRDDC